MRSEEVRPGFWLTRGAAKVVSARAYHRQQYGDWEHLGVQPPPRGCVVVSVYPGSIIRPKGYSVAAKAREALSALGGTAEASHSGEIAKWAVERYHEAPAVLGRWCLKAGAQTSVKKAAAAFVAGFGPLTQDFGGWCASAAWRSAEGDLWPKPWRTWARSVYDVLTARGRALPVPAPVGFYVWASLMIGAVRGHPGWQGCEAFLINRLAAIRLQFAPGEMEEFVRAAAAKRLSSPALIATGELLDLLAARAAFGLGSPVGEVRRYDTCQACGAEFPVTFARRRYCSDACARRSGSIRQARHRTK